MKINTNALIEDLEARTRYHIEEVEKIQSLGDEELNRRPAADSWSALECIEHLNRYGTFYLPEIRKRITTSKTEPQMMFKSGLLGNYFAKGMLPKEKLNKMKTFKDKDPAGSALDRSVLDTFLQQQREMLELLEQARGVSLNKVKTAISISKWLKLKLGDTFRVVIYHNLRHIEQAKRAIGAEIY